MTSNHEVITLIHLTKSYKENKYSNYVIYNNIQSAKNDVMKKDTCSLEVLSQQKRKIYLDVENIPFDEPNVIDDIISKFTLFMKIIPDNYCLTYNKNSTQHNGLSYHVIFPYVMNIYDMKKSVIMFKTQNPEYENFIDISVYSTLRLFRLPFNGKVTGSGINNSDYHDVIHGSFNDSFIQTINNLPTLSGELLPEGFNDFNMEYAIKNNKFVCGRKFKKSGYYKMEEFTDAVMTEFHKLKLMLNEMKEQNKRIEKMNDILFLKILELEQMKYNK